MKILDAWDAGAPWDDLRPLFLEDAHHTLGFLTKSLRCMIGDDVLFLANHAGAEVRNHVQSKITYFNNSPKLLFPVPMSPEEIFELSQSWMEGDDIVTLGNTYGVHPARIAGMLHRAALVPCPAMAYHLNAMGPQERDESFSSFVDPTGSIGRLNAMAQLLERQFELASTYSKLTVHNPFKANLYELRLRLFTDIGRKYLQLDASGSLHNLYHITAIENLQSIMETGLHAHSEMEARAHVDISDGQVQWKRKRNDPVFGRPLHDYVPTYLNPRNPMLFLRQPMIDNLAIAVIDPLICDMHQCIFTDGNAASSQTSFSRTPDVVLSSLDVLQAKFWLNYPDGKRRACSEVLIHGGVGPEFIKYFICGSVKAAEATRAKTDRQVIISRQFFFD